MDKSIRVSIICNAYNHEEYIESALKGFVSQKTNFKYEVLVHDDASTDNTANIIKKYEILYPEIIKPIYQDINQYSQNINITKDIQVSRAQGEYIALCEGDDYWIDDEKLQKQFDLLEKYQDIDLCTHAAFLETDGIRKSVISPSKKDTVLSLEEVIINDGDFFATSSIFIRKKIFENDYIISKYGMDYTWQMLGALRGGTVYIKDVMSVYRFQSSESWTSKMAKNTEKSIVHCEYIIEMLNDFDIDTLGKYVKIINFQKATYLYLKGDLEKNLNIINEAKKILCSKEYAYCYSYYSLKIRIKKYLKFHFTWLWKIYSLRK